MHTKKLLISLGALALCLSLLLSLPMLVYAHHGYRSHRRQAETPYALCTVEGCTETGRHLHDGVGYCGYDHDCGYCDRTCQLARRQAETPYALCTVEGCTEAGRHLHDGVGYCGYNHDCGYCDGTCQSVSNQPVAIQPAAGQPVSGQPATGHHHGHGGHGCH